MESSTPTSPRRPNPAKYRLFNTTKSINIPSITKLRAELDYGHPGEKRDVEFYKVFRSYITDLKSSSGIKGQDLFRWKLRLHQDGLLELASKFLDEEGYGSIYWPDNPNSPLHGKLEYSKDFKKIKRTIMQLVLKANQQRRWKGKKPEADPESEKNPNGTSSSYESSRIQGESSNGSRRENPTDLPYQGPIELQEVPEGMGNMIFGLPSENEPVVPNSWNNASTSAPEVSYTTQTFHPSGTNSQSSQGETRETRENPNMAPMAEMSDPYDVPDSPELGVPPAIPQDEITNRRLDPTVTGEESAQSTRVLIQATEAALIETDTEPSDPITRNLSEAASFSENERTADYTRPQLQPIQTPSLTEDSHETEDQYEDGGLRQLYQRARTEPPPSAFSSSNSNPNSPAFCPKSMPPPPLPLPMPTVSANSTTRPSSRPVPLRQTQEGPKQISPTLPKISIVYTVNVSQNRNTQWTPKGHFMNMPLQALRDDLPLNGTFTGLEFVLETPGGKSFDGTIDSGDLNAEEDFEGMKSRFRKKIMAVRRERAGSSKVLHFEIAITPIGSEGAGKDDYNDDDEDEEMF